MVVYAVKKNMDYIKITNKKELDEFLKEYDSENEFRNKPISVMLVYDEFLRMKENYQNLFNSLQTGKLQHLLVITDSDFEKHFEKNDEYSALPKTEFGELFTIGAEYKPILFEKNDDVIVGIEL